MRTALFLVAGFLLLAAALLLGKLFSTNYPGATFTATAAYVALWLVVAGANMWVGVARAGYSVTEELPIFLLIFGLPAAVAIICGAVARCRETDHGNRRYFRCTNPKCGEYEISHTAMGRLDTSADFKTHASEAISRLRDPEKIYEIVFDSATGCVSERAVTRRQELR